MPRFRYMLGVGTAMTAALLAHHSMAEGVKVFDYTPSVQQLRDVLAPKPQESRGIYIPKSSVPTQNPDVQPSALPSSSAPSSRPAPPPLPFDAKAPEAPKAPEVKQAEKPPIQPQPSVSTSALQAAPLSEILDSKKGSGKKAGPKKVESATAAPVVQTSDAFAYRINFALNSTVIPRSDWTFLDRLAEVMKEEPRLTLEIEGHTDARGDQDYNMMLSEARAEMVGLALVHRGITADRLMIVGKGQSEPIVSDPLDSKNRRVQFARVTSNVASADQR